MPLLLLCWAGVLPASTIQHGLRVPDGFQVTEYAGSDLANDIYCMTLDPQGRVVVSGRGYIRVLVEDGRSGKAVRSVEILAGPKDGAMGLLWESEWLYYTGDGALWRVHIPRGAARPDRSPERIRALKTGGEHSAHAICRGPDGWLYVLCGNMTGINRSFAQLPTSPIKEPVAGCVLRFTPDLKQSEIVADGFRNAYGMDFSLDGELFTFDSDNERCVSLPWYEPIRFYHVIEGGHHGWQAPQRADWWRWPPYFPDVVAPVATFGRGSPTGVVCYRHAQFPEKYRGGIFLLDWTFGRVYFAALQRSGSSYTCRQETFLEAVGENGFAPTAAVVHPETGDLYISIGGRGTRGAVYRVRHLAGWKVVAGKKTGPRPVARRSLDWKPNLSEQLPRQAETRDYQERLRALIALRRFRTRFSPGQIGQAIRANWDAPDRYLRQAAADLIATLDEPALTRLARQANTTARRATLGFGVVTGNPGLALGQATTVLETKDAGPRERLEAVRLMQLAWGGLMAPRVRGTVWEGYTPRPAPFWAGKPEEKLPPAGRRCPRGVEFAAFARALHDLRRAFPSGDPDLDREVSRTLAVLEDDDPGTLARVAAKITDRSNPVEDIHYLIVLARLKGPRSAELTARTAAALVHLDQKLDQHHLSRDRHWPLRVAELHAELARKDPGLNKAILAQPEFGRPGHVVFTRAPGFDRRRAAALFLARAAKDENFEWNAELVGLLGELPREPILPVLRRLWEQGGLQEAILPLLARHPEAGDREKFLEGLRSPQVATMRRCLEALEKLPPRTEGSYLLALVQALQQLPEGKAGRPLEKELTSYLGRLTGQAKLGTDRKSWASWFRKSYPKLAARLDHADGVDMAVWNRRLAALDFTRGDARRGQKVFLKASCASCHSGAQALGPDLHGVTGRFSREDLFTAILLPSKDVSPRYRTTQIVTADGKVYQGLVIYEAVGSVLLQTGPATMVRITNKQITERRTTQTSLMPAGLLDKLNDQEIADLYAYLKSLGTAPSPKTKLPSSR